MRRCARAARPGWPDRYVLAREARTAPVVIGEVANTPVSVPTPGVSVGAVGEAWGDQFASPLNWPLSM